MCLYVVDVVLMGVGIVCVDMWVSNGSVGVCRVGFTCVGVVDTDCRGVAQILLTVGRESAVA